MDEQKDSTFGTTIWAFTFNGDEKNFQAWEGKTLALATAKGFLLSLTKDFTSQVMTTEEYEYGEIAEESTTDVAGNYSTPATSRAAGAGTGPTTKMRPTTAAENWRYLARSATWSYLVASCTGTAYALIEQCDGDPRKAWKILCEKYCGATDAEGQLS